MPFGLLVLTQIPLRHICAASASDLPTLMHLSLMFQQFMYSLELPATYTTLVTFTAATRQPLARYVKECRSERYWNFMAHEPEHLDDLFLTILAPEFAIIRREQAAHDGLDILVSFEQKDQIKIVRRETATEFWRMYVRPKAIRNS